MKSLKKTMLLGVVVLAFCTTAGVYALQSTEKATNAKTAMDRTAMMEKMHQHMQARMEKHRTQLHDKLQLSAAQEPAWKTFTDSVMSSMSGMHHAPRTEQDKKAMETMTTPAHMEKMLARAKARVEQMQKNLDALNTFYAVLSPEQQKIFDQEHNAMRKSMHHGMQKMHEMKKMHHMGESKMGMERK